MSLFKRDQNQTSTPISEGTALILNYVWIVFAIFFLLYLSDNTLVSLQG